jgi:hypothetical protein
MTKCMTAAAALIMGAMLLTGCAAPSSDAAPDEAVIVDAPENESAEIDIDPTFATADDEMALGVQIAGLALLVEWSSVSYVNDAGSPKSLTLVSSADAAEAFAGWTDRQDWTGWETYASTEDEPYMFTAHGPQGSVVAQQVADQNTFGVEFSTAP